MDTSMGDGATDGTTTCTEKTASYPTGRTLYKCDWEKNGFIEFMNNGKIKCRKPQYFDASKTGQTWEFGCQKLTGYNTTTIKVGFIGNSGEIEVNCANSADTVVTEVTNSSNQYIIKSITWDSYSCTINQTFSESGAAPIDLADKCSAVMLVTQ